jgi:PAS domain S-box-containing protein
VVDLAVTIARQLGFSLERAEMETHRRVTEEALRQSEERLRAVFDSPAIGVAVLTPDGRFLDSNDAFRNLCGHGADELRSLNSLELTHPDDRQAMSVLLAGLMDGSRSDFVIEKRYVRKDGSVIWVQNSVSLTHDESGRPLHLVKLIQNITERKVAEKRQRLLIDEINHRVKNTLATVQSFASQSLRNAESLAEGRAAFEARLLALSKSHDVLTRQHWEGADLIDVVNGAIAPYRGRSDQRRFRIEGERLRLRPKAVLALSLAFHELATNAVKYGALSNDIGNVAIDWRVCPQSRQFELRWQESGGPAVSPPLRRGFGSRLVEQGLAQDIAGDVRLNFNGQGVACSIDAPLHEVAGSD